MADVTYVVWDARNEDCLEVETDLRSLLSDFNIEGKEWRTTPDGGRFNGVYQIQVVHPPEFVEYKNEYHLTITVTENGEKVAGAGGKAIADSFSDALNMLNQSLNKQWAQILQQAAIIDGVDDEPNEEEATLKKASKILDQEPDDSWLD